MLLHQRDTFAVGGAPANAEMADNHNEEFSSIDYLRYTGGADQHLWINQSQYPNGIKAQGSGSGCSWAVQQRSMRSANQHHRIRLGSGTVIGWYQGILFKWSEADHTGYSLQGSAIYSGGGGGVRLAKHTVSPATDFDGTQLAFVNEGSFPRKVQDPSWSTPSIGASNVYADIDIVTDASGRIRVFFDNGAAIQDWWTRDLAGKFAYIDIVDSDFATRQGRVGLIGNVSAGIHAGAMDMIESFDLINPVRSLVIG